MPYSLTHLSKRAHRPQLCWRKSTDGDPPSCGRNLSLCPFALAGLYPGPSEVLCWQSCSTPAWSLAQPFQSQRTRAESGWPKQPTLNLSAIPNCLRYSAPRCLLIIHHSVSTGTGLFPSLFSPRVNVQLGVLLFGFCPFLSQGGSWLPPPPPTTCHHMDKHPPLPALASLGPPLPSNHELQNCPG